jgi:hypothetical protein
MEALKERGRILIRGMGKLGIFKALYVLMSITCVISVFGEFTLLVYESFGWSDGPLPSEPPQQIDPAAVLLVVLVVAIPFVFGGLAWLFHKLDEAVHWGWI